MLRYIMKVEDNSAIVLSAYSKAKERALYAMGIKAVEGSVDAITGRYSIPSAVDTGRLRASISFITDNGDSGDSGMLPPVNAKPEDKLDGTAPKNAVVVGSNVEYAEYVHDGTSKMTGRPFLREGIDKTKNEMEEQVKTILKGGTI